MLNGKWFDMEESGEKPEEYRGSHWAKRLLTQKGLQVFRKNPEWLEPEHFQWYGKYVASRGYTDRTLTRKIKRIRWGTPRPEWSGDTVTGECFIIELEDA